MFLQKNITHRCSHCYQDEYGSELTFDSLKKILHQYINFYDKNSFCGHIKFTGGEQLLSEYLFPLMELCDINNITFGLLTNSTLIDENTYVFCLSLYNAFTYINPAFHPTRTTRSFISFGHSSTSGGSSCDSCISCGGGGAGR